jgi:23S rRNA (pseudouridine1915-N3)-methyltransferase
MIRLFTVGKMKDRRLAELVAEYARRIRLLVPFEIFQIKDSKPAREAQQIIGRLGSPGGSELVVVLDEKGDELTSQDLAALVGSCGAIAFVIGGPDGLAPPLRDRADRLVRLSALTLTHEMARLLLCEQVYRALTILRNMPYHRA